ncbi:PEP-CTERM sorting domain-containing protein [Aeoliella sp.]|uniref:PEP-CTERM sorting domain-containing protein n=1 Tax=Aeoliella sp. TaxID=2795800 RepID=UPI003CCC1032
MRYLLLYSIAVAIALIGCANATIAQNYLWIPTAEDPAGDWNDKANWTDAGGDFVPEGNVGETAEISSGGTAFVQDFINNTGITGGGMLGPGAISLSNESILEIQSSSLMSTDSSGGANGEVSVNSGASLRFLGSGALVADSITMGAGGIFDYRVTPASPFGTARATIDGSAQLGGVLQVNFGSGASFMSGDVVQLVNAASVDGEFAEVNVTGNVVGGLGMGQRYAVQKVAGGNGTIAQLAVEQRLILTVDRDTTNVSISNPSSTSIAIDGYSVGSAVGSINDSNFTGLGAGWSTSPTSSSRVTQLRNSGTTAFANGTLASIGTIFDPPAPTEFGVDSDDIEFSYTLSGNIEQTGFVNYVGDKRENNLVLTIDDNGMAAIQNESTLSVDIEGYTISSAGGLLDSDGWNSLDEQNAEGGLWAASPISDEFRITELMNDSATTFSPLKGFNLGQLYDNSGAGSVNDLTFQFLVAGETEPMTGIVVFGDLPDLTQGLEGDFNGDGFVNLADYVVWRNNLGAPDESVINNVGDGLNGVDAGDYVIWKDNFGISTGAAISVGPSKVPEPGSVSLLLILGAIISLIRKR